MGCTQRKALGHGRPYGDAAITIGTTGPNKKQPGNEARANDIARRRLAA
jgi:hypothetical protein